MHDDDEAFDRMKGTYRRVLMDKGEKMSDVDGLVGSTGILGYSNKKRYDCFYVLVC